MPALAKDWLLFEATDAFSSLRLRISDALLVKPKKPIFLSVLLIYRFEITCPLPSNVAENTVVMSPISVHPPVTLVPTKVPPVGSLPLRPCKVEVCRESIAAVSPQACKEVAEGCQVGCTSCGRRDAVAV